MSIKPIHPTLHRSLFRPTCGPPCAQNLKSPEARCPLLDTKTICRTPPSEPNNQKDLRDGVSLLGVIASLPSLPSIPVLPICTSTGTCSQVTVKQVPVHPVLHLPSSDSSRYIHPIKSIENRIKGAPLKMTLVLCNTSNRIESKLSNRNVITALYIPTWGPPRARMYISIYTGKIAQSIIHSRTLTLS